MIIKKKKKDIDYLSVRKLNFKDSSSVKIGDILAEWDPFTFPLLLRLMGL